MQRKTIVEARNELGITQTEMADQLNMTRQTYAKLEQHPENLSIRDARTICEILGKRFSEIFFSTMVN